MILYVSLISSGIILISNRLFWRRVISSQKLYSQELLYSSFFSLLNPSSVHHIILELITLIALDELHKSWSSSTISHPQHRLWFGMYFRAVQFQNNCYMITQAGGDKFRSRK